MKTINERLSILEKTIGIKESSLENEVILSEILKTDSFKEFKEDGFRRISSSDSYISEKFQNGCQFRFKIDFVGSNIVVRWFLYRNQILNISDVLKLSLNSWTPLKLNSLLGKLYSIYFGYRSTFK